MKNCVYVERYDKTRIRCKLNGSLRKGHGNQCASQCTKCKEPWLIKFKRKHNLYKLFY